MKISLQHGLQDFSIVRSGETDPNDIIQEFENDLSARGFLSDIAQDYNGRLALRNALAELLSSTDISRLSDADVIARLARKLASGELIVAKRTVETSHWLTDRVTTATATTEPEDSSSAPEEPDETPQISITETVTPNDNDSFTTLDAENDIELTAEITPSSFAPANNPNIEWEIQDDPNVDGQSPVPNTTTLRGNEVSLAIAIPLVPNGRNWNTLNYRVRAKVTIDGEEITSDWVTFQQDEIDMMRQQYIDMGKTTTPARNEFINAGSTAHFALYTNGNPDGACRCGNHEYHIWSIMDDLEDVRAQLGHPMPVASGYRCPIHNAAEGGATNSQHIYGTAADVTALDYDSNGIINTDDRDDLHTAAQAFANWTNDNYVNPMRVHMDWR